MTPAGVALDLGWAEFDRLCTETADRVRAQGVPDVVVGVLRGGMVPAVVLAHRLDARSVRGVEITRTVSDAPHAPKRAPLIGCADGLGDLDGRDVLLVDDVAGSGATAQAATAAVLAAGADRVRRVVVVVNTANWDRPAPDDDPFRFFDHVGTICRGWVRFPWEGDR